MNTPIIYTATPADLSPPVQTDSICVVLVLATDYQKLKDEFKQLAAENVAIREQSEEVYAAGYNHGHLNTVDGIAYAGCVKDDFYSLALQVMAEVETPATDRIVAGIKADGVGEFVEKCREKSKQAISSDIRDNWWLAGEHADDFAKQLREGAK